MEWFQYRAGVVLDSLRVAHRAAPSANDRAVLSWCQRTFHLEQVEEVCEPDTLPEPGMAAPLAPCVPCLLLVIAATESPTSSDAVISGNATAFPATEQG